LILDVVKFKERRKKRGERVTYSSTMASNSWLRRSGPSFERGKKAPLLPPVPGRRKKEKKKVTTQPLTEREPFIRRGEGESLPRI